MVSDTRLISARAIAEVTCFCRAACQKILQQKLTQLTSPSTGVASVPRPTTPNHYTLGRHYGASGTPAGAAGGFSSSSLSSVVAGSTLGPAGAGSIGTGHSSLAALSGSALNLHSSGTASTNGALNARGTPALTAFHNHRTLIGTQRSCLCSGDASAADLREPLRDQVERGDAEALEQHAQRLDEQQQRQRGEQHGERRRGRLGHVERLVLLARRAPCREALQRSEVRNSPVRVRGTVRA